MPVDPPDTKLPAASRLTQLNFDALPRRFVLPNDALRVDLQQDVDAVTGPLGDLRW